MGDPFDGWLWPMEIDAPEGDPSDRVFLGVPVISSAFGPRDRNTYSCGLHLGVDICYRWKPGHVTRGPMAATRMSGGKRFGYAMPPAALVYPVGPGEVIKCGLNSRGFAVAIDHGNTVITWYQHIRQGSVSGLIKKGRTLAVTDLLGVAGYDLADAKASGREGFNHLHFAWLFKSAKHPAPTRCHDMGRSLGLGFRAIALDPAIYLAKLAHRSAQP